MRRSSREVPILTYHSIDDSGSRISVSRSAFDRQIRRLRLLGYSSLSLLEAVRCIRNGGDPPERTVVVTFDDGYRNNLREALPVLSEHGFTATVFVTTGYVGARNAWSDQHASIPGLSIMSWEEIREMRKAGVDFGAHTHNHVRLTQVDPEDARHEMLRSKMELEDEMGESVSLFSYPFGDHNETVRKIAAGLFEGAIGNRPGRLHRKSDPLALDRINMTSGLFKVLPHTLLGGANFGVYLSIKRTVDRMRNVAERLPRWRCPAE